MGDEISVLADRLMVEARVLALQLDSILVRDPARGEDLRHRILEVIEGDGGRERAVSGAAARHNPDEIEQLILAYLVDSEDPQSVEQIYQFVQGAVPDVRKPSLNVKLHRMATITGAIVKAHHGHYTVTELERRRARTGGR